MIALGSSHKRKIVSFFFLAIAIVAFTTDIVDLRDELRLVSCHYTIWDQNITTGLQSGFAFDWAPVLKFDSLIQDSSSVNSYFYISPAQNRAPPSASC